MQNKRVQMITLGCLYCCVLVDNLGAALIIPLLAPLFLDATTGIVPTATSVDFRNTLYGVALGAFSLAMFIGSPLLGALSDRMGRKKILLICLMGLFVSYALSGLAIAFNNSWLFLFARVIGGFASGSLPIAQAAIVDISTREEKVNNIARIMFFVSGGYIAGPLLGGYLSDSTLVSWFNLMTPLFTVAAVALLNLVLLAVVFRETFTAITHNNDQYSGEINWLMPFKFMRFGFKQRAIRGLMVLMLLMTLGWNTYFQFIGLFLSTQHHFTPADVATLLSAMGIGFALTFLLLVGLLVKYLKPRSMLFYALVMMALSVSGVIFTPGLDVLWILAIPGSIGFGLAYSALMGLLSSATDASHQGTIMGMAAAVAAFSAGISGFIFGPVANIDVLAPMLCALIFLVAAGILSIPRLGLSPESEPLSGA